ncbi:hypothetical protein Bca4012_086410 [Brassica carinata]
MIKLCAKYCRRGFTSVASSFKHGWEEQNKVVLGFVFMGGWFGQSIINAYKRREHWLRVHKFLTRKSVSEGKFTLSVIRLCFIP